jgi:hypothetical protein
MFIRSDLWWWPGKIARMHRAHGSLEAGSDGVEHTCGECAHFIPALPVIGVSQQCAWFTKTVNADGFRLTDYDTPAWDATWPACGRFEGRR